MPRRLLAVALAGAVALTGLSACRSQPTVAAYVGSAQLSNADVEKIVDEFPAETREAHAGDIRRLVVSAFVTREVARQIARDRKLPVPVADPNIYQGEAAQLKVSATGGFFTLQAEAGAAVRAIEPLSRAQAPTDADQRAVYAQLVQAGDIQPGTPYGKVKDQLDSPEMRQALGLRTVVADGVKTYGVQVNPRYQPLGIPVPFTLVNGQVQAEVTVPLDQNASPAVVSAG